MRRMKLCNDVIDKICAAREIGATYEIAALHAGVSPASLSDWLKTARAIREETQQNPRRLNAKEKLKVELLKRLDDSDAAAALTWLQVVDLAASNDPNWALRMLQLRYKDYNPVQRNEISTPEGGEIVVRLIHDED